MEKRCGPLGPNLGVCGRPAATKRVMLGNTRDVCAFHAVMIDRLRARLEEDKPIMDALRRAGD